MPGHLPTFAAGTRNSLRRKPAVILVGEARDAETIGEAVTASMTGHALYSTVHANGFPDTIRRMVNVFPESEKNGRAVDIVSSLRMVICQRLVPSTDGKRVALREYVVFNDEIVDLILGGGLDNLTTSCRKVLRMYGRSFAQDAQEKFDAGRISERTLKEIQWAARGDARDAEQEMLRQEEKAQQARYAAEAGMGGSGASRFNAEGQSREDLPGVMGRDEMSHVSDPEQEPRLDFGLGSVDEQGKG